MTKKIGTLLLAVFILGALAPMAFAANGDVDAQIQAIYEQITELRSKLVDLYVQSGRLTPEQGDSIKENLERIGSEGGYGFYGDHCGAVMGGYGMMGGYGLGYGMMSY